ncbi:CGNR zinc finger domain-containing protein [Streptomyces sp. AN091965]|uniref:CGNR zinc finger domain-containing protein n=1 Tax=Streptomyces sp. AN091965 TaxID=2927803 RepID=UPI001F60FFE0|nr:CGNR zinc finger domain-containing protein [Streptomyces sp. AN091965]MCI3933003.1 CGNR zinc finger domain-containing protein [Streptomyces sp. AN091965]
MHFNHYGGEAALLAADLVNAYAGPDDAGPSGADLGNAGLGDAGLGDAGPDDAGLGGAAPGDASPGDTAPKSADPGAAAAADDPSALLAAHSVVEHALSPAQRRDLRAWARRLADCFGPQGLAERCARLNRLLEEASSRPYIALHDGTPHFHYSAPGADPAAHVRALTAAGLAYIVCHADARRLGRCARAGCGRAFVDTSRAGRRAYCSVRCANNDAVARHRARRPR